MEPIIVRFFKRTNQRWFNKSIVSEEESETSDYRKLRVTFARKSRDTGKRMSIPGFSGSSRIMEDAGMDKGRIQIRLQGESLHAIPTSKDVIDEYVRRMRPDDVERLTLKDKEIDGLRSMLTLARTQRLNLLHDAFQRGHKVTVKELVERAEATS